uniref:Cadherin n=1 Tax=Heterorhabditis bacteriophora TaxID=37862 RepID=A0A1I7XQW9_HETBA
MEKKSLVFSVDNSTGVIKTIRSLHGVNSELLHITATNKERKSAKIQLNIVVVKEKSDKHSFTEKKYLGSVKTKDPVGTVVFPSTIQNNHPLSKFTLLGEDSSFFEVDNKVLIYIENDFDQVPQFEKSSYYVTVMENLPRNSFILQPQIIQESSTSIEYSIEIDNHSTMLIDLLDIDDEGRITNKNELLALQAGRYQFVQLASEIQVVDVDDHQLRFEIPLIPIEISEDTPVGSVITTMRAFDQDTSQKLFYRLKPELEEIKINASNGQISLALPLDREREKQHRIQVGVFNTEGEEFNNKTVSATLVINVKDVNDNGPIFEHEIYDVLLPSSSLPGRRLITVNAFDPDEMNSIDDMRYVYYSIKETTFNYRGVSHSIEGFFTIDQVTGEIRIEQGVSDFVGGMFHIRLESADSIDENAHRGTCSVQIYVYSESDIVHLDMPYNPMELNISQIEQMKRSISNLTTLNVMVKDVLYHHIDGQVVNDVTDLRLVFINESTFEIIAAEKALAVIDRYRPMMGNTIPTMTKAQME